MGEMKIFWTLSNHNRTPFVSTMRSTKAPEKPALINSRNGEFGGWRTFEFTRTKPLLQRRGTRVDHFLRNGSHRLWQPEILMVKFK